MATTEKVTVGEYLSKRLEQIGLRHYFAIPGDYNLALLDELLKNKNLSMINCCNELNAGYAADGYARAQGISALVVTFSVGSLSALNAIAGAYGEDLPIILISGGPNTNSEVEHQILHHTTAEVDYKYCKDIFAHVTALSVIIEHVHEASYQIDNAILTAIRTKKPVYIELACNIATSEIPAPQPLNFFSSCSSDPESLNAAVNQATAFLNAAEKPILVGGVKLRSWGAIKAFEDVANASGYAVAMMPNAKSFFSEKHPSYIGTYWGSVSTPGCGEVVESCDAYLFAGPVFSDYTTTGFSALINPKKMIHAGRDYVRLPGNCFQRVYLNEFLSSLSKQIKRNDKSLQAYNRIKGEAPAFEPSTDKKIQTRFLFSQIQNMLDSNCCVVTETGDSWFNGMRLKLPDKCAFEIQMQYGSIGWSVGAALGYALGSKEKKKVIALIGDGSFQMSAQEVSTMIRYNVNITIFLINNGSYSIEVQIHDNIYNVIKNWHYADLVNVFNASDGKGWGCTVKTEEELKKAIEKSNMHPALSFIEVMIDRDDVNKSLLKWGTAVSMNNSRAPKDILSL